jgi:hypothetical protein
MTPSIAAPKRAGHSSFPSRRSVRAGLGRARSFPGAAGLGRANAWKPGLARCCGCSCRRAAPNRQTTRTMPLPPHFSNSHAGGATIRGETLHYDSKAHLPVLAEMGREGRTDGRKKACLQPHGRQTTDRGKVRPDGPEHSGYQANGDAWDVVFPGAETILEGGHTSYA